MAAAARSLSECAPAATFWLAARAPVLATLPTPAAALLKPPPALAAPIWNADVALLTVAAIERAPLAAIRVEIGRASWREKLRARRLPALETKKQEAVCTKTEKRIATVNPE